MAEIIDLKKIERRAYLTYHKDGIWDIFMGMSFLSVGILKYLNLTSFVGIYPAIIVCLIPLLIKAKKSFTQSRTGFIEPSSRWRIKEKKNLIIFSIVGFLSAIAGLFNFMAFGGNANWQTLIRDLGLIPFGIVISIITFIVGALLGIKRFLIYAFIIMGVFIAGHYSGTPIHVYFILLGVIISLTGLVVLIWFIRKYPKAEGGIPDEIIDRS